MIDASTPPPTGAFAACLDALAVLIIGRMREAGPGPLPTEPALAARLGVGRSLVREASRALAAKGMLLAGPRVGARSRPLAEWSLLDADVVRWLDPGSDPLLRPRALALWRFATPAAARAAAEREERGALVARLDDALAALAAPDAAARGLAAFHGALLRGAADPYLAALAPLVGSLAAASRHPMGALHSAHAALRDALAAGAVPWAVAAAAAAVEAAVACGPVPQDRAIGHARVHGGDAGGAND